MVVTSIRMVSSWLELCRESDVDKEIVDLVKLKRL